MKGEAKEMIVGGSRRERGREGRQMVEDAQVRKKGGLKQSRKTMGEEKKDDYRRRR